MNIIKQAFSAITRLHSNWKTSNQQAHIDAIQRSFYLEEKDGMVYIIHNAVAIMKFYPTENIDNLIKQLTQVRNIAVQHEYGNTTQSSNK